MTLNPDNIRVNSRESGVKSSDVKGRPSADPDAKKDFRKVLDKDDDSDENKHAAKEIIEESDGIALALVANTTKKKAPSPFDLSGRTPAPFEKPVKTDSDHLQSPASLFGKMESADRPVMKKVDDSTIADVNLSVTDKDHFTTRFATEQPDLSYVNPLAAVTPQQSGVNLNISVEKPILPASNIQEIINQMIAKVTEIKDTGSTDTVVTLKYPPLFEGARIIVTSFDSAKNEFNITIENLTQQAKNVVDLQANKDHLLLGLQEKGYAVHILTTTTTTEERIVDALPQPDQGKPRDDENKEGKQQQGRNRQNQA